MTSAGHFGCNSGLAYGPIGMGMKPWRSEKRSASVICASVVAAQASPAASARLCAVISCPDAVTAEHRSEEHTSELQSLMRISYAVFCLKKKKKQNIKMQKDHQTKTDKKSKHDEHTSINTRTEQQKAQIRHED